ncbi:hypothetical protein Xen7305DRAFT_00035090 [Xenococcus sp. PCC 7305]|uniref:hypothetical protein n=1 Tax=Xenococcus sp. PCC 7305 TaxID=102125 RepID=UPI0002AC5961|nr:hypothetical protein [Xenococcus sp. PCC 7305]ELS03785.1 hypothetical protein Xen7305DRAFT_00035090 [Xenococcus sp. PCC 7305]
MASSEKVKQYLACWFQLGKRLFVDNGREILCPKTVIIQDKYSPEFEACWNKVLKMEGHNCYLEGVEPTIDLLLSSAWEIASCVNCQMPIPRLDLGLQASPGCPCVDIPLWPNTDLPLPHSPINNRSHLNRIRSRLNIKH